MGDVAAMQRRPFESTMRDGGAVVAVSCTEDRDVAEHACVEAGASEALDETAPAL